MELTGVAEAARREEAGIPECLREKWFTEATSGLNDWLGADGNLDRPDPGLYSKWYMKGGPA